MPGPGGPPIRIKDEVMGDDVEEGGDALFVDSLSVSDLVALLLVVEVSEEVVSVVF